MIMKLRTIKNKKEIWGLVGLFLGFNFYKIIFSLFYAKPSFDTPQDLFSTLYASATLARLDWYNIGSTYSEYYGYGFFSIFFFLFRILKDGLIIYRILVLICNLLSVFSCILCYKIAKNLGISNSTKKLYLLSIVSVSFQHIGEIGVANEYPLNLCVWIVIYLLLSLCNQHLSKKKQSLFTLLLGMALIYSCTVHARAIILYVFIFICIITIMLKRHKVIVNIPIALASLLAIIPYKLFTNYLQITLLGEFSSNSSLTDRVIYATGNSQFSLEIIQTYFISIIVYLHETLILSGGLATICLAGIFYKLYCQKKQINFWNLDVYNEDKIICGTIFCILGIAAFLFGVCYTNINSIYEGIILPRNKNLRVLTLTRYYMPFVGPAIFFTIGTLFLVKDHIKKIIINIAFILFIIVQALFLYFAYPVINFTGWAGEQYIPFTLDKYVDLKDIYLVGMIALFLVFYITFYTSRKSKWSALLCFLFIFNAFGQSYTFFHRNSNDHMYTRVNAGYDYLKEYSNKEIYVIEEYDDEIQFVENYYFLYQLLLPHNVIIPLENTTKADKEFILTGSEAIVNSLKNDYNILQLDNNEWLLTKKERSKR